MVDLVCAVVQGLEGLGVEQTDQKMQRRVVVGNDRIERYLLLSKGVQIHIIMVCDSCQLGQVEGSQTDGGGDQDAFGSLSRRLLEHLVLTHRHALRVVPLLLYLGLFQHPHHKAEVLLLRQSDLPQHEDDGL